MTVYLREKRTLLFQILKAYSAFGFDEEIQLPKTMTLKTSDRLSAKGEKATLKVASWNINGIRAWLTNGGLKYIEQEQPDMICFQVKHFYFRIVFGKYFI